MNRTVHDRHFIRQDQHEIGSDCVSTAILQADGDLRRVSVRSDVEGMHVLIGGSDIDLGSVKVVPPLKGWAELARGTENGVSAARSNPSTAGRLEIIHAAELFVETNICDAVKDPKPRL